jgi:hypothetical protein
MYKIRVKKEKKTPALNSRSPHRMTSMSFDYSRFMNYDDKTMLHEYPDLIHKDKTRRRLLRTRHKHNFLEKNISVIGLCNG